MSHRPWWGFDDARLTAVCAHDGVGEVLAERVIDRSHGPLAWVDVVVVPPGVTIGRFALFALSDKAEQDDHCARIYNKSLLYMVSRAFEARPFGEGTPLLGMEKWIARDAAVRELFTSGAAGLSSRTVGQISNTVQNIAAKASLSPLSLR